MVDSAGVEQAWPLLVTARIEPGPFDTLDRLRRQHFPAHLNKVPAHISLFHHLPGGELETVVATATARCRHVRGQLHLQPVKARSLGRGVGFVYRSDQLGLLRAALANEWAPWLTPQDRQPFQPHVTIQNKVDPATARNLFEQLRHETPPPCSIDGLTVWRYLGGPWQHVADCLFSRG
jgi:2'-5' RNA ligase